jgi:mycothiol synthase
VVIEGTTGSGLDDDRDLPPSGDAAVRTTGHLDESDLSGLGALVAAATAVDGVGPLSEHALLHLRTDPGPRSRHLVVREAAGERLVAVAHIDLGTGAGPAAAELVVRPERRRAGLGSAVLQRLESLAGAAPLRVWAHGDLPAARGFAHVHGYRAVRELWQMSRRLTEPLPTSALPDGFALRAFRPGEDDDAWLAVNAAAFAHHAEQGAWQLADLQQRMAEPWFDPAGFLLLVDDATGELAGFHWTKVHPADARGDGTGVGADEVPEGAGDDAAGGGAGRRSAGDDAAGGGAGGRTTGDLAAGGAADHGQVGEVYVVGVAPDFQGRGLAKPLTLAGLQHLRGRGLARVVLYVDGDNEAALRTYSGLGFTRRTLVVLYARP